MDFEDQNNSEKLVTRDEVIEAFKTGDRERAEGMLTALMTQRREASDANPSTEEERRKADLDEGMLLLETGHFYGEGGAFGLFYVGYYDATKWGFPELAEQFKAALKDCYDTAVTAGYENIDEAVDKDIARIDAELG